MSSNKILINPPGTEKVYKVMRFSQAVKAGNMIFVSGQVGIDRESNRFGEGIEEQTEIAFQNLRNVLKEAGGDLGDIVELVTYHTSMDDIKGFSRVKSKFIKEDYPAWTAVEVTALVRPELLVEIKATAMLA